MVSDYDGHTFNVVTLDFKGTRFRCFVSHHIDYQMGYF